MEPGYVQVRGELRGDQLCIAVENSAASAVPASAGTGIGLQNVRRRLEICYGSQASFRLDPAPLKTTAELSIPRVRASALL